MGDAVHSPSHYTENALVLEPKVFVARVPSGMHAMALKYVFRNGTKPGHPLLEDLQKAMECFKIAKDNGVRDPDLSKEIFSLLKYHPNPFLSLFGLTFECSTNSKAWENLRHAIKEHIDEMTGG